MKDTGEIVKELQLCEDFKTFYDENRDHLVEKKLAGLLSDLLEKKGLKKVDVVHAAELSEVYSYQIFAGLRLPDRKKLLCLSIAMELNLEETQKLLQSAGYAPLYVKLPFDSVVLFGICKGLTVVEINNILFDYGLETLG